MKLASELEKWPRTVIEEPVLARLLCLKTVDPDAYLEFHREVSGLVDTGFLAPVKNSGSNGRRPPLYRRYRIVRPKPDHSETLRRVKMLHFALKNDYYLRHPDRYLEHKEAIQAINSFLSTRREELATPCSVNERSYQIFGDEKFLAGAGRTIVKNLGLDLTEDVRVYETPEPFFFYHVPPVRNVLIVENKDTWYTLTLLLKRGKSVFFGTPIQAMVYGEGKKILRSFSFVDDVFPGDVAYWYCGDLDHEGVSIWQSLNAAHPAVKVFVPFYEALLAQATSPRPSHQDPVDVSEFLSAFMPEAARKLADVLSAGLYIPQEALGYSFLSEA